MSQPDTAAVDPASINYTDFVYDLAKKGDELIAALAPGDAHLWHMITGLSGESGELLESIRNGSYASEEGIKHIQEELGDLEFYNEGVYLELPGLPRHSGEGYADAAFSQRHHIGPEDWKVCACSIVIACSHIVDAVKRRVIYRKELDMEKLSLAMLELANDLALMALLAGSSRKEVRLANVVKLLKRYKGGKYSDADAQARADKPPGE